MTELMLKPGLTVAIITKNEATNLEPCLLSLGDLADDIIIIDSGSTDATAEIAARFGAKLYAYPDWPGFGLQRNRAHNHIETEWVLWLDADERLSDELRQSIRIAFSNTAPDSKIIFKINRLTEAFGKFIYHCGWYPDEIVRLYPTAYTRYNNHLVHESVIVPQGSQLILLAGDLLHHTYQNINQYLSKQQQYTLAWAQQRVGKKKATPLSGMLHGLATFIRIYLLKRGFLDGQHGLLIALLGGYYSFLKYTQLWFLSRQV